MGSGRAGDLVWVRWWEVVLVLGRVRRSEVVFVWWARGAAGRELGVEVGVAHSLSAVSFDAQNLRRGRSTLCLGRGALSGEAVVGVRLMSG